MESKGCTGLLSRGERSENIQVNSEKKKGRGPTRGQPEKSFTTLTKAGRKISRSPATKRFGLGIMSSQKLICVSAA